MELTSNTKPAPLIICRCCGKPMGADFQEGLAPGKSGYWLLTCRNRACQMNDYTFGDNSYATVDLSKYCTEGA